MDQAGHLDVRALRERQQLHAVAQADECADHGQHGERRAAHLEEGLRRQEQDAHPAAPGGAQCERYRSASIAAMQPVPAAVIAWR
jgi:hypothetical protein